jgi:ketosteroid isomerase-like protein
VPATITAERPDTPDALAGPREPWRRTLEAPFGEWTFSYVLTEAVPRSTGRKVRFRGMSLFELEGGRVARYREYFDTGAALLQLGFAPESPAKVLAKRI